MGEEYVENKNAEGVDQNQKPATTSIQIEIEPQPIVEKVTASPKPGTYTENQTVELASATEGATIYYTINLPGIVYKITKGAGSTHQLNTNGTITVTCSAELSKLTGVYVDDKLVDSKNYTTKEGSTILTFKTGYLNTLEAGTYKLRFEYTDGSAETTFTITKAEKTSNQTNDTPKKTTGTKTTASQTATRRGLAGL